MKTKLLKRLRRNARAEIDILSVTTQGGTVTGMKVAYSDDAYRGLFTFGMTEYEVLKKAEHIYIKNYIKIKRGKK